MDSKAPESFEDVIGMTVFAAQAVDDRITFLREPLSVEIQKRSLVASTSNVVIVGGSTPTTHRLIKSIEGSFDVPVYTFEQPKTVDHSLISADSTIISLSEIDKPVFKDMTPEEFFAFKRMFTAPAKLVWVTSGRLHEEPFTNMTVGFARTAVHETPLLHFQNIDIADLANFDPNRLVELVLRFQAITNVAESERDQLLWAKEPEIAFDSEGHEIVPRLRPIAARNDRYNSARRPITHEANIGESPAVLQRDNKSWSLREISKWGIPTQDESSIKLRVTHAIKSAIRTAYGHKFLILGTDFETQAQFLALVPSLLSVVIVPKDSVLAAESANAKFLTDLAASLVSLAVMDPLVGGETVIVHNPSELLAQTIASQASSKDVRAIFVADSSHQPSNPSWVTLAAYPTKSEVTEVIPTNAACFVGLSDHELEYSENESTIRSTLPRHCRIENVETLYSSAGWANSSGATARLGRLLQRALEGRRKDFPTVAPTVVAIRELIDGLDPADPITVIDWTSSESVPAHVTRLDSAAFFKGDKTYWMCGLSGALGVSLCDWMIERGAKYLVLTSRNPNISPQWIENHGRNGVKVTIVPW